HRWRKPGWCACAARHTRTRFFSTEAFCLTGNERKTSGRRKTGHCGDADLPACSSGDGGFSERKADICQLRRCAQANPRVRWALEKKGRLVVRNSVGTRGVGHRDKNVTSQGTCGTHRPRRRRDRAVSRL